MSITQIIECHLSFSFKSKEERCGCSFPKGVKILKNYNNQNNPLTIFLFYEGTPNGHREEFTFLLVKQEKPTITLSENTKLEANEHIKTFTNNHGTFHLFKLNNE